MVVVNILMFKFWRFLSLECGMVWVGIGNGVGMVVFYVSIIDLFSWNKSGVFVVFKN